MKQGYTVFHNANRDSLGSRYNTAVVSNNCLSANEVVISYCNTYDFHKYVGSFTVAIFRLKLKEQCKN